MKKVIVVGSGPAGMASAYCAAKAGAEVLVLDENSRPGGQVWKYGPDAAVPKRVKKWQHRFNQAGVACRFGCTVVDIVDKTLLISCENQPSESIVFDTLILACGARELFLPFPGWTLPNVMGAGGAIALLKAGWSFHNLRVVVSGSGPLLFAAAGELAKAGAKIVTIAEQAPLRSLIKFAVGTSLYQPGKLIEGANYGRHWLPAPYRMGTWISQAKGDPQLRGGVLYNGTLAPCDGLACAYGLVANTELAVLAGCRQSHGRIDIDQFQRTSVDGILCAGEMTGIGGMDLSVTEGQIAGLAAVDDLAGAQALIRRRQWQLKFADLLTSCFSLREKLKQLPQDDTIICRCEDVTYSQLKALYDQVSAKMYTRSGMGACQGRVCSPQMKYLFGWKANRVRSPLFPVRVGDLVGKDDA